MTAPITARYGMVIDLNSCVGCQTCTIACKHANDTPPGVQWRKVIDVELGQYPNVERLFLVTGCQHCAAPPCVPVCPTGATKQRPDGLVTMNYDTCIGCGYCAVACPYQARTIVHEQNWYYGIPTAQETQVAHDDRIGVANKCTFCVERIDSGLANGLTPGLDPDATPACAISCIATAIHFGDFADPGSDVSQLAADGRAFQMHEELGTDPQIKYLYGLPGSTPGRDRTADDVDEAALQDPGNPLVGQRQSFWDMRAAMNFTLGGMGAGLVIMAWLAHVTGALPQTGLLILNVIAGGAMAVGLFCVFLEIARKARFLNVLLRPQTSWMTRETYAVAVFYPALLADLIWPSEALHLIVALAAAAFLYCQARILPAAKGIPAWRAPLMPWMLLATGLLEGAGLLAIAADMLPGAREAAVLAAGAGGVLAVINALLWRNYMAEAKTSGVGPLARAALQDLSHGLRIVGHALPVLGFALFLSLFFEYPFVAAIAGLGAIIGGAWWKITVITIASHQQGFALSKVPQRGSGTRAAPARMGTAA
ncbi:MAG: 4Fe-4S dicluster domain-containing protein [Rhodospirillaceae bacterium]|jgi:Fe-S-cluster-containing dehydrogenase component/DMSO reductase anchor subunit|nr:4Fe-4S dicluster domain-containing protein [Rhodospirillaceae bacterium]MBT4486469.1 4Fe-4S dicluster domain-containing protein [Rhodospirillaceae bacterium]MBT5195597.1 4Fe-4S dicluster domain-containing protein [Rhodospirillaceae bacterium]MBT5894539.1 4Fe-4S dicluster domain-containing protein [Rhodospirillaceae bacterium]MBT6426344.1 4Fe-4S dicluster domain-containing protein [Rhodospirillaceae bacterium]